MRQQHEKQQESVKGCEVSQPWPHTWLISHLLTSPSPLFLLLQVLLFLPSGAACLEEMQMGRVFPLPPHLHFSFAALS